MTRKQLAEGLEILGFEVGLRGNYVDVYWDQQEMCTIAPDRVVTKDAIDDLPYKQLGQLTYMVKKHFGLLKYEAVTHFEATQA